MRDGFAHGMKAVSDLLDEKGKTHGSFDLTAERAGNLQDMTRTRINEPPVVRHAREMICVKLARIASGNPLATEHWDDIAGYAKLVADWLREQQQRD